MDLNKHFIKPEGVLGWLAGQIMAVRNRERSEFVLSLLDLMPEDRVLEIGFGPGMDIQRASRMAGYVAGVDHSSLMVSQATHRNGAAVREGRVKLELGTAGSQLPFPDGHFNKVFAINSAQFWKDLPAAMKEISRVLKPGGAVALGIQPRKKNATDEQAFQVAAAFMNAIKKAGFIEARCESRKMNPVATACALGVKSQVI